MSRFGGLYCTAGALKLEFSCYLVLRAGSVCISANQ